MTKRDSYLKIRCTRLRTGWRRQARDEGNGDGEGGGDAGEGQSFGGGGGGGVGSDAKLRHGRTGQL